MVRSYHIVPWSYRRHGARPSANFESANASTDLDLFCAHTCNIGRGASQSSLPLRPNPRLKV